MLCLREERKKGVRNSHTDNIREEEKALHGGEGISLQPVLHAVVHGNIPCFGRWMCCHGNAAHGAPTLQKEGDQCEPEGAIEWDCCGLTPTLLLLKKLGMKERWSYHIVMLLIGHNESFSNSANFMFAIISSEVISQKHSHGEEGVCAGGGDFVCFCFSQSNSVLIGNKINVFSPACTFFFFFVMVTGRRAPCLHLNPQGH